MTPHDAQTPVSRPNSAEVGSGATGDANGAVRLTEAERASVDSAFGFVPEPEPLLHMVAVVESLIAARVDAALAAAVPLIRRALFDPGALVKRGPDYDGNEYGERLDKWQERALQVALARVRQEQGR